MAVPVDRKKKDQMENIVAVKKIGIVKSVKEKKRLTENKRERERERLKGNTCHGPYVEMRRQSRNDIYVCSACRSLCTGFN